MPLWISLVVGSLVLLGQIGTFAISPILERRKLARTSYALTNQRVIVYEHKSGGRLREESKLISGPDAVTIETLPDGRGTVRIGYQTAFERVRDARALYNVLMQIAHDHRDINAVLPDEDIGEAGEFDV